MNESDKENINNEDIPESTEEAPAEEVVAEEAPAYRPDSQRYFDYHHTSTDTFDKVNKRELEWGSASMTSLIYLMDKYLYTDTPVKP